MKEQYKCSNCKWVGDKSQLDMDGFNCPECGGKVNVGYQLSMPLRAEEEKLKDDAIKLIMKQPAYQRKSRQWVTNRFNEVLEDTDSVFLSTTEVTEILEHNFGIHATEEEPVNENKRTCCYCGTTTTAEERAMQEGKKMFASIYGGGVDTIGWVYNCIKVTECIDRVRANYAGRKGDH
jgi:DNA-directed RNA polymerase subunit RPC12/RpoP